MSLRGGMEEREGLMVQNWAQSEDRLVRLVCVFLFVCVVEMHIGSDQRSASPARGDVLLTLVSPVVNCGSHVGHCSAEPPRHEITEHVKTLGNLPFFFSCMIPR